MYMPFFFDPTMILLIPGIILGFYAQYKVKSTYARYSKVTTRSGFTGREVARRILDAYELQSVPIESIPGELTDHYDPRSRTLRLSSSIYNGRNVAALGIAAHECGHAIQHAKLYMPLTLRNAVFPVVNIGSKLWGVFFMAGIFMAYMGVAFGVLAMKISIILFAAVVVFQLVTLPVEFNASNRAMTILANGGFLESDEIDGSRKVLNAAALTYVAGAVMAILQLIRLLSILNGMDGD